MILTSAIESLKGGYLSTERLSASSTMGQKSWASALRQ
jgi:hypothetical protein